MFVVVFLSDVVYNYYAGVSAFIISPDRLVLFCFMDLY